MADDPTPGWETKLDLGDQVRNWEQLAGAIEEQHAERAVEAERIEERERDRDRRDELMFKLAVLGLVVAFLALIVALAALAIAT